MRCGIHQINARITTAVADSRKHIQILPLSLRALCLAPGAEVGRADCSDGKANQEPCYRRSHQTGLSVCLLSRQAFSSVPGQLTWGFVLASPPSRGSQCNCQVPFARAYLQFCPEFRAVEVGGPHAS